MNWTTQKILLEIYKLAYRSGFLSTEFGWRVYCGSYRMYKGALDNDLEAIKNIHRRWQPGSGHRCKRRRIGVEVSEVGRR